MKTKFVQYFRDLPSKQVAVFAALSVCFWSNFTAQAQGIGTEDEIKVMINTAGYSAVFGAAMGAALLPFIPDPGLSSLRYIAAGASVGFFAGTGVALYRLSNPEGHSFAPEHSESDDYDESNSGGYSVNEESPLHGGALFVGNKSSFAITVPVFSFGSKSAWVQLVDYRF